MHGANMSPRRTDTGTLRRERIQKLHSMIQGAGDVDLSRLIATIEYQMGVTPNKIREYLQVLVTLGFVEVDEAAGLVREVVKA